MFAGRVYEQNEHIWFIRTTEMEIGEMYEYPYLS